MRRTVHLVFPGITLFGVLLIASIVLRSLSIYVFLGVLIYGYGVIPIALILAIAGLSFFYGRRHWLSGLSIICAVTLLVALWIFPHPVNSPVAWAANVLKVIYYRSDLQHSYVEAKQSGRGSPVGQVYTDGFGSLTSGLAYDPSGEIALPVNRRSKTWIDGAGATELGIDSVEAHHIFGAYYQWFHP